MYINIMITLLLSNMVQGFDYLTYCPGSKGNDLYGSDGV
jgi:hypothetical protein